MVSTQELELIENAKNGSPEDRMKLGIYYFQTNNHPKALYWFEKVAEEGAFLDTSAYLAGTLYIKGKNCPIDKEKGKHWLTVAYASGNKEALNELNSLENPSNKALHLLMLALGMTIAVFVSKGFWFGLKFALLDWVVFGFAVNFYMNGRCGSLDSQAGMPGGTCIFSVLTIIASLVSIFIF